MDPRSLYRLLAIIQRELDADDARIEIGGRAPDPASTVHANLDADLRVVVIFDTPPADRAAKQAKLDLLVSTFGDVAAPLPEPSPVLRAPIESALDEVLEDVRTDAHAVRALVIDDSSPVVWGTSVTPRDGFDVERAQALATLWDKVVRAGLDAEALFSCSAEELTKRAGAVEPRLMRELVRMATALERGPFDPRRRLDDVATARAIAWVRSRWDEEAHDRRFVHREGGFAVMARSFATTYRVLTVHRGPFSELHAEAALSHALPVVEALVLRLPPVDPGHGEGRVLRLHRRKV